mgnify:CR=1 FL=1
MSRNCKSGNSNCRWLCNVAVKLTAELPQPGISSAATFKC